MYSFEKIVVLCVGNKMVKDDCIGSYVMQELKGNYSFSDNVEIIDAGCLTWDCLKYIKSETYVIAVDSIFVAGVKAGSVVKLKFDDLVVNCAPDTSLHDLTLSKILVTSGILNENFDGCILGLQIKKLPLCLFEGGLSRVVLENLQPIVDATIDEIVAHGGSVINKKI